MNRFKSDSFPLNTLVLYFSGNSSSRISFFLCLSVRNISEIENPDDILEIIGGQGITSLVIEGGHQILSTFYSNNLIDEMYINKKMPELGGESGIRTAFFSDIESFSRISEQLNASGLVELLNEFLSEQTEILIQNNGTLDKYEGDAILAFFGAPIYYEDHARQAIDTGIELHENLHLLKKRWKKQKNKWPEDVMNMNMRIGINTGEMVTGNMGSKLHMNYTMMGEVVNLASRLETAAKFYGVYFHSTYKTLNEAGIERYEWRFLDKVILYILLISPIYLKIPLFSNHAQLSYYLGNKRLARFVKNYYIRRHHQTQRGPIAMKNTIIIV